MMGAMPQQLPPLVWLRAFDAAGRLQSFKAAARELHVTPSAVSHHVRSLENFLGRPLFQRSGNRVRLTTEGETYLHRVSAGFAELARAADVLSPYDRSRKLIIGAFPYLVSEVLLPQLAELRERLPGISLSIVSGTQLGLLTHIDPDQRVDALIRYGNGHFPSCTARKLTDVSLIPIAAPGFVRQMSTTPEFAIANGPRVAVEGPFDGWSAWAETAGITLDDMAEVLTVDSYLAAMRAVEQGLGAGLGIRPFIDGWLTDRRIEILLHADCALGEASYLVTAQHANARPELDVLHEWLLERFHLTR